MVRKLIDEFGIEYPLPDKSQFTIGRSKECDVTIPPSTVSEAIVDECTKTLRRTVYNTISRLHATANYNKEEGIISLIDDSRFGIELDGEIRKISTFRTDRPAKLKLGYLNLDYVPEN